MWLMPFLLVLLGGCSGAFMPSRNCVFSLYGTRWGSGQVFGIAMGVSSITHSLSPVIFGIAADRWDLRMAMSLFTIPALAGALVGLLLILMRSRSS
jgi:hypothetical protein